MNDIGPIRREIVVELEPGPAFELFTSGIGEWWPVAYLSVFGAESSVAFRDGALTEVLGERTTAWGEVTEWIPGERVAFTWHPGRPAEQASHVTVTFSRQGEGTRVVLEHVGWEAFDDPEAARREYDQGWPMVLDRYAELAHGRGDTEDHTWVALMHRPGPQTPKDRPVFDDPRFADHVQFLSRMQDEGYLVAAGPMLDANGEGMTILRLPGEGRLAEAHRLATTEDASVTGGLFEVSVRPWRVMMRAQPER